MTTIPFFPSTTATGTTTTWHDLNLTTTAGATSCYVDLTPPYTPAGSSTVYWQHDYALSQRVAELEQQVRALQGQVRRLRRQRKQRKASQ